MSDVVWYRQYRNGKAVALIHEAVALELIKLRTPGYEYEKVEHSVEEELEDYDERFKHRSGGVGVTESGTEKESNL